MVKELGDKAAQGRTYGNLGNTYYLLGEFETAVAAHEKVGGKQKILSVSATDHLLQTGFPSCIFKAFNRRLTILVDIGQNR